MKNPQFEFSELSTTGQLPERRPEWSDEQFKMHGGEFVGCVWIAGIVYAVRKTTVMKNVVSFNVAADLHKAGFPQPEINAGQYWYNQYGTLYYVIEYDADGVSLCANMKQRGVLLFGFSGCYFAPTAEDILRVLGLNYSLGIDRKSGIGHLQSAVNLWTKRSAAEACAAAWLAIQNPADLDDY